MENNVFDFKTIDRVLNDLKCQKDPLAIINKLEHEKQNFNHRTPQKPFLKKYNEKIDKIQRQKIIDNNKRIEASRKRDEQIEKRLRDLETRQRRKTFDLIKRIENKERTSKNLLKKRENLRLSEKRNNEIKSYLDKVKHQNITLAKNKLLIDKCVRNNEPDDSSSDEEVVTTLYEEEIENEPLEEIEEEECFIDSDQSRIEEICNQKDLGMLKTYLDRIVMLKKNFGSCEAGRYFLIKTAPLWDSLTQCIYRKSMILEEIAKNSDNMMPEEYRKLYEENASEANIKRMRGLHAVNTSFLEELITDLGYEISDEDLYHAFIKAKRLLDCSATALELMELVKLILKYEISVRENVLYVYYGICRRTVFEYSKKRISYHMLGHSKNIINRLKFLNDIGLVPNHLLTSKNCEKQVEPIIFEFLTDDVKYGYLTAGENTIPEHCMYPRLAETKVREFSDSIMTTADFVKAPSIIEGENLKEYKVYGMPGKKLLEIHVDTQVCRLMAFVLKQLPYSLSKRSTRDHFTDYAELTRDTYNILARKITKMVFHMGGPYEEKLYVLEVVMKKIAIEILKRSPKVLYKQKNRHNAVTGDLKLDISFFSKRLDTLRASKKIIK